MFNKWKIEMFILYQDDTYLYKFLFLLILMPAQKATQNSQYYLTIAVSFISILSFTVIYSHIFRTKNYIV